MGISEEVRIRSQRRAARYLRLFPPIETQTKVEVKRERDRRQWPLVLLLLLTDANIYSLD